MGYYGGSERMRVTGSAAMMVVLGLLAGTTEGSAQALGVPEDTGAEATARAILLNSAGVEMGRILLRQTPANGVLLDIHLAGVEPGTYAIHIHETGACRAPGFQSAGGHYAPRGNAHGALHEDGMHAGDLPNLHVPESGSLRAERIARDVSLQQGVTGTLFDDDGSAIVVHAGADDYRSQPSGDAGGRMLCGVIRP